MSRVGNCGVRGSRAIRLNYELCTRAAYATGKHLKEIRLAPLVSRLRLEMRIQEAPFPVDSERFPEAELLVGRSQAKLGNETYGGLGIALYFAGFSAGFSSCL
jgi:hypothetical protein